MFNFVPIIFWLIIILPIAILITGILALHFKPTHRRTISILMIILGSLGALIFVLAILAGIDIEGLTEHFVRVALLLGGLVGVEVATILIGVVRLRADRKHT